MGRQQQAQRTSPRRIRAVMDTADMLRLRMTGEPLAVIGQRSGISPQAVHDRIKHALATIIREPAEELRQLDSDRLEAALRAIAPKVMQGSLPHIDRWERLVMSHAKLHGLTQLSVVDDPGATLLIIETMRQMGKAAGLALPEPIIEGESREIPSEQPANVLQ